MRYVLGFAFSADGTKLALIKKIKPAWQNGLFNAIGGKIEDFDDTPHDAMVREFKEETGVFIPRWTKFVTLHQDDEDYEITCFYYFGDEILEAKTMEAEEVSVVTIEDFHVLNATRKTMRNLATLRTLVYNHRWSASK